MQEFKLISKADPEETKALRVFVTNVETVGPLHEKLPRCLDVQNWHRSQGLVRSLPA
jgi:hypothetical protein